VAHWVSQVFFCPYGSHCLCRLFHCLSRNWWPAAGRVLDQEALLPLRADHETTSSIFAGVPLMFALVGPALPLLSWPSYPRRPSAGRPWPCGSSCCARGALPGGRTHWCGTNLHFSEPTKLLVGAGRYTARANPPAGRPGMPAIRPNLHFPSKTATALLDAPGYGRRPPLFQPQSG